MAESLKEVILARQEYEDFERVLAVRRLVDSANPEFALSTRTRQLRVGRTEGEINPKVRPLAVAFVIPRWHAKPLWLSSETRVFEWLLDSSPKYAPLNSGRTFGDKVRPIHDGIMICESEYGSSAYYRRYMAIERAGLIELGLGSSACMVHENQIGYFLTPIVASIWGLIGFATDLYRHFGMKHSFSIVLALRETNGAVLGGLAQGWTDPWSRSGFREYRPTCIEPNILIVHRTLGPTVEEEEARKLAREIAYEIEAAWGHGGIGNIARCFKQMDGGGEGEFDLNAARR